MLLHATRVTVIRLRVLSTPLGQGTGAEGGKAMTASLAVEGGGSALGSVLVGRQGSMYGRVDEHAKRDTYHGHAQPLRA